jgi:hypothetical protein
VLPRTDLVWLAPACVFGFLLGPYLDLTFHRARQRTTPAGGRAAFGVGFGAFFFLMIVFTAFYARPLGEALASGQPLSLRDPWALTIAIHITLQAAFTIVAHAQALAAPDATPAAAEARVSSLATTTKATPPVGSSVSAGNGVTTRENAVSANGSGETRNGTPAAAARRSRTWLVATLAVAVPAAFLGEIRHALPVYHGLDTGEVVYRLFMAFYGLVFPAYAWICMAPLARGGSPLTRGKLKAFAIACLIAAPMFWMGFIERKMIWLVPGLLVILIARFLAPRPAPWTVTEDHPESLASA